jgi:oligoendopeptidase F
MQHEQTLEKIYLYASLRLQEDLSNSESQGNYLKAQSLLAKYNTLSSFIKVEIMAIDNETIKRFIESEQLHEYSIYLSKLLHHKGHTLSDKEEALLAPLGELFDSIDSSFSALTNADMQFGSINDRPLTQSSYSLFLKENDRTIRKQAYTQFYNQFKAHQNTLSALYGGSIRQDIYNARIRGFTSSRSAALFTDKIDEGVYDNLIATIHKGLPSLHRYYALRQKLLKVDQLKPYDVYVPLIDLNTSPTLPYHEGVALLGEALKPLGQDYVTTMQQGLLNGWVDRYENIGKRSGAFSSGGYQTDPYILLNYKDNDIRSLFTLAHEAGHSMHSYYSAQNNPFQHYNYTIFEAEVASTFNEALLFDYLLKTSKNEQLKQRLIGERLDDILSTLFRQTMFAEYEHEVHCRAEQGEAAALPLFTNIYDKLLHKYFGPAMHFEEESVLECLRIPHFYRAFYVYKYSTGIAASLALSEGVLQGGKAECANYLSFLKSGGSLYPLENLTLAGVNMASAKPIEAAINKFSGLLDSFESF